MMDQSILTEITKKAKTYWMKDLVSIVVFGSFAKRRKKYNDVDLLIVLKDIKEDRIRRIPNIVGFKASLDVSSPVDVLLLSKRECAGNFRNHNPLFLDVTLDGVVVYDMNDFARGLIDETARYIKDRNIVRKGTAWFFPLKTHVAALSKISNADWARVWINDSSRDLESARILYTHGLFEKSVYHSVLCVEKAVKAILICFGAFERKHEVSALLESQARERDLLKGDLKELISIAADMEEHIVLSRYPASGEDIWIPCEKYNDKDGRDYLDKAERAYNIAAKFVDEWLK